MQRTRRRTSLIVVASLAMHGLMLTPLALNLFGSQPERPVARLQTPIYVDITPGLRLAGNRERSPTTSSAATKTFAEEVRPDTEPAPGTPVSRRRSEPSTELEVAPVPHSATDDRWRVRPEANADRMGTALHRGTAGCRTMAGRLDPVEQAHCDQVFAEAAADGALITGTNNPVRDARFAAVGDQALADYDRRRAPLKPNSRANPCPESPNPGDPCAFTIKGRIWSSRDGWLPDLPGRQ